MPRLVTIPRVELCRLGTWACSNGVYTFRPEDFAAAVAAQHDPEVPRGPVKIGHTDPRFSLAAGFDGEPALGWVRNITVEGDRLLGDLVDVPEKLAALIPTAYPRRSIEFGFDIHTPSGRRYPGAVMGLALLGVAPPAVSGLADVISLFDGDREFELAAATALTWGARVVASLPLGSGPLGFMPAASAPAQGGAGHTAPDPTPAPGGTFVAQITDARIRELLGIAADADAEAALSQLRQLAAAGSAAGAVLAPPPAPQAPAPLPGSQPFIPQAGPYQPPAPAAAPQGQVQPVAPLGTPANPLALPTGGPLPLGQPLQVPGLQPPAPVAPAPIAAPQGYAPQLPGWPAAPAPTVQPPAVPAPVAQAPVAPQPAPAPVVGQDAGAIAAAVAAAVQPLLAAAAAPGIQVAEHMRVRDREAVLAGHARRGALRPADVGYFRGQYDVNPSGTIAYLAALPASFPTFELGMDAGPGGSADPQAIAQEDAAFLASLGIQA